MSSIILGRQFWILLHLRIVVASVSCVEVTRPLVPTIRYGNEGISCVYCADDERKSMLKGD